MKKSVLFLAAFLIAFTSANAQWGHEKVKGNGDLVTKTRSTGTYDGVLVVGSYDVVLVKGKEGEVKVKAESNLQEYITTEVKNGMLKISTKEDINLRPTKEILVTVPFEEIEKVAVTGSGDITNSDIIKAENFKVQVTGSGDVSLNLDVKALEGQITGSGDISLKGNSRKFSCQVTGSGDFNAFNLKADAVEASVSGSGDIHVYPVSSLNARVAGSGDIIYKGNPEKQDFKTSGSGSVSSN